MDQGRVQKTIGNAGLLAGLAVACAAFSAVPSAAEVVYERKNLSGAADRCLLVPRSEFTLPALRTRCSKLLGNDRTVRVSRLFIAMTRDRASMAISGKGGFDSDFGQWMREVDTPRRRQGGVAECIQIGDSAVLRVAWENGQVQESVLRGRNILHQRVNGLNVDLRWLFTSTAHLTGQNSLNVCLGTDGFLAEENAVAIATHFDTQLGVRPVWYDIRSDPWFVDDDFYPWVNPFYPFPGKPSREEYMKTYSYLCKPDSQSGRISCSRFGPRVP